MSLVFYGKKKEGEKSIIHDHPKHKKKKRVNTPRYNNPSILKASRRFLTSDSYGLPLEVKHLNDL
jgi:hypothetical protein